MKLTLCGERVLRRQVKREVGPPSLFPYTNFCLAKRVAGGAGRSGLYIVCYCIFNSVPSIGWTLSRRKIYQSWSWGKSTASTVCHQLFHLWVRTRNEETEEDMVEYCRGPSSTWTGCGSRQPRISRGRNSKLERDEDRRDLHDSAANLQFPITYFYLYNYQP